MQGHLTKRGKLGLWSIVLHVTDPVTGQRSVKWIATGTASKRKAQATLTRVLADYQDGRGLPLTRQQTETLGQYLTRWLGIHSHQIRKSTARQYSRVVDKRLAPGIGHLPLTQLRPDVLQAYFIQEHDARRNDNRPGHLSVRSVQIEYAVLRRALNDAVRWGLIDHNPLRAVDQPKPPKPEFHPWSPQDADQFLRHAEGSRFYAIYLLLLTTGMRIGEACGLRWADVDLDARTITVQHTLLYGRHEGLHLGPTKTGRGRMVPIGPDTARVLRHHRVQQAQARLLAGSAWQDDGFMFTTALGQPLNPTGAVYTTFRRLTTGAGLPPIRLHDLRHTSATLLLQAGVHPKVVQERLGHSTIQVTMDTYSHVTPTMQRDASERIDAIVGAGRAKRPTDG